MSGFASSTAAASPVEPIGCPSRTHHLVGPEPVATPILPAGANLKITTSPNALRIDVTSLPARYRGSDIGRLEGGAVIVAGQHALEAFGTMPLSGKAEIGALFSDTDNVSVASGSYQIRGYTPAGLWENEVRELRGGALLTGARVRFVDMDKETATGHVAVMLPDPKTALMRVTAISEHTNSNLGVRYYFTDEVIIGPSFLEALLLDPLVQLLAMALGAFAGYGWLNRLLTSADRNSTQ